MLATLTTKFRALQLRSRLALHKDMPGLSQRSRRQWHHQRMRLYICRKSGVLAVHPLCQAWALAAGPMDRGAGCKATGWSTQVRCSALQHLIVVLGRCAVDYGQAMRRHCCLRSEHLLCILVVSLHIRCVAAASTGIALCERTRIKHV